MSRIPSPDSISQRFYWLRLPLILGVIVAHAGAHVITLPDHSGWSVYLIQLIAGVWARNNVSLLFLMSGYLFFHTFQLNWQNYHHKLSRRMRTLVIPYLFWNIANLLFLAFIQALPYTSSFFSGERIPIAEYTVVNYLDALLGLDGEPVAYAFWFLRDLILMVMFAPIFFLLAKHLPWVAAVGFYVYWFISPDPVVILTPRSLFWFYLGAVLAIQRASLDWLDQWRGWIVWLYLVISIVDAAVQPQNRFLHHTAMTVGVAAFWVLAARIGLYPKLENFLGRWAAGSFFVFAFHEPLLTILAKLFSRLLDLSSDAQVVSFYVLLIVLTSVGSMLAWKLGMRYAPALTRFVSGGR
jgi:hypothetical protein